jgi:hypothetical protein
MNQKPTVVKPVKVPRRIANAKTHLIAQREKAIAIRDAAEAEIKMLDASLLALGWPE